MTLDSTRAVTALIGYKQLGERDLPALLDVRAPQPLDAHDVCLGRDSGYILEHVDPALRQRIGLARSAVLGSQSMSDDVRALQDVLSELFACESRSYAAAIAHNERASREHDEMAQAAQSFERALDEEFALLAYGALAGTTSAREVHDYVARLGEVIFGGPTPMAGSLEPHYPLRSAEGMWAALVSKLAGALRVEARYVAATRDAEARTLAANALYALVWPHDLTLKIVNRVADERPSLRTSFEVLRSDLPWQHAVAELSRHFVEMGGLGTLGTISLHPTDTGTVIARIEDLEIPEGTWVTIERHGRCGGGKIYYLDVVATNRSGVCKVRSIAEAVEFCNE